MGSIKEIIDLIIKLFPFILEIVKLLKGTTTEEKVVALESGKRAIANVCVGDLCNTKL